ncbi:MAG: NlpC/P60 family protein [Kofleriaceae bacterium]
MTLKASSLLTLLFTSTLMACAMDPADGTDDDDQATSTDTAELTASNPAPFDLHCLWAGESYASRAPNQYAAQAIRNACDIQASLIPYHAPGMYPLQNRPPTAAEGIDCSGLTSNVWYRATSTWTRLPHSAAMQEATLRHIGWGELLPGDLLFYVSSAAASGRHVAMYLGDSLMIEAASSTRGVVVSPVRYNVSSIGRIW